MRKLEIPKHIAKNFKPAKGFEHLFNRPKVWTGIENNQELDKPRFNVIGRGFIFKKHQEAIEKINGDIADFWNDYVVILTPSDTHIDFIKKYSEKIILCEKPVVVKKEDLDYLDEVKDLFTCHQLRYLPLEIKKEDFNKINIDIRLKRDKEYFESWKGEPERSGGMLLNIAIHYFDLLFYHFGFPELKVKCCKLTDRLAEGRFMSKDFQCDWRFEIGEELKDKRLFEINKKKYDLSPKINLYILLYQDLLQGRGTKWQDVKKLYQLIFEIYEHTGENYFGFGYKKGN